MNVGADDRAGAPVDFLAELPEQIVYLLYQVYRRRENAIEQVLEAEGLPLATWRMLLAMQRMQPCTMNALARFTTWERSALTRLLDQMVKQGLAQRATPPEDRRQVLVSLTDTGMALFEKGRALVMRLNRKTLEGMSPEHLVSLRDNLDAYLHSMIPDQDLADDISGFNRPLRSGG